MKLSFYPFILAITLTSANTHSSHSSSHSDPTINFDLSMICRNVPFLTQLHTFSTPDQKIHATFHLSNSNDITKRIMSRHLFSEEKKRHFFSCAKKQMPSLPDEEIEQMFQSRQTRILEQATDPENFATLETPIKNALRFKFIDEQTVCVSLNLEEQLSPFVRNIRLFSYQEFSPEPPIVTFNPEEKTVTQTFNILHKNAPKKPLHVASWLYMKRTDTFGPNNSSNNRAQPLAMRPIQK